MQCVPQSTLRIERVQISEFMGSLGEGLEKNSGGSLITGFLKVFDKLFYSNFLKGGHRIKHFLKMFSTDFCLLSSPYIMISQPVKNNLETAAS